MKVKISNNARKILMDPIKVHELSMGVLKRHSKPEESFDVKIGDKNFKVHRVGLQKGPNK
jgi:hypothetical protein